MNIYLGKIKNTAPEIRNFVHKGYGWWFSFVIIRGIPFRRYPRCNVVLLTREVVVNLIWRHYGLLIAMYDE